MSKRITDYTAPATGKRPDLVLDLKGACSGWCALIIKNRLRAMSPGQILLVMGDDPLFATDLPLVFRSGPDRLLKAEIVENSDNTPIHHLYLLKGNPRIKTEGSDELIRVERTA